MNRVTLATILISVPSRKRQQCDKHAHELFQRLITFSLLPCDPLTLAARFSKAAENLASFPKTGADPAALTWAFEQSMARALRLQHRVEVRR